MHRHRLIKIAAFTGIAFFAAATAANAGVTIDAAGQGFVGKGDVQTVLGLNNAALQKAVDAKTLVFTAQQPTAQSLSHSVEQAGTQVGVQSGSQTATQFGSQSMSQDLTCTYTNGNGTKVFHRNGDRDGSRLGAREGERIGSRDGVRDTSRDGIRTGAQTGVQSGNLAYGLEVEARKNAQYTGFNLHGWKGDPSYSQAGAPTWDAPAFGGWEFGSEWSFGGWTSAGDYAFGDYSFGEYTFGDTVNWGEWDALAGENPDDCLRSQNADKITQISNVITDGVVTDGAVVDGVVTDGAFTDGSITDGSIAETGIAYGTITPGQVAANGSATVLVNGKALSPIA